MPSKTPKCELCGNDMVKVIYGGLPGRLCSNDDCNLLTGPALFMAQLFFNGMFYQYDGNYFVGLWYWFTDKNEEL